jgi:hypothetical protein
MLPDSVWWLSHARRRLYTVKMCGTEDTLMSWLSIASRRPCYQTGARRLWNVEGEVSKTMDAHLAGTVIQTGGLQTPDELPGSCCVANVRRGIHVGAVSSVTGAVGRV